MSCKYNNSMYTIIPSSIILEPESPQELEETKIRNHLDEENYNCAFIDIDEAQICELIKWENVSS